MKPSDVAKEKNSEGKTALHIACQCGVHINIIEELLRAYSVAASEIDNIGRTPLHLACKMGADANLLVVKRLIKVRPDTLGIRDKDGQTPLDVALNVGASQEVIDALKMPRRGGRRRNKKTNKKRKNKKKMSRKVVKN
jgi:ankyrin repeat protein